MNKIFRFRNGSFDRALPTERSSVQAFLPDSRLIRAQDTQKRLAISVSSPPICHDFVERGDIFRNTIERSMKIQADPMSLRATGASSMSTKSSRFAVRLEQGDARIFDCQRRLHLSGLLVSSLSRVPAAH